MPTVEDKQSGESNERFIILFDGVCNFCNYWVDFIIKRDKKHLFRFSALQSEKGRELLASFNLPADYHDSIILISGKKISRKSAAAFQIAENLSGFPGFLTVFRFLPESFSDLIYDLIAGKRYKIFGKKDTCRIPAPEEQDRFI